LALGTAENDHELFIAIIFHQFFEGLGLGSRVADADLRRILSVLAIDFLFAASAPVGIGIGLGIKSAVENGSMAYSVIDGTFQVRDLAPLVSQLSCSARSRPWLMAVNACRHCLAVS
jgi:zinc transporter 1/2/3